VRGSELLKAILQDSSAVSYPKADPSFRMTLQGKLRLSSDKKETPSACATGLRVLLEGAELRAVGQTVAAARAFDLYDFVYMVDVLHFRMNRALGANFTAEPAGDAQSFDNFDFHVSCSTAHCAPPRARLGSEA
jgi:hypothetical protein